MVFGISKSALALIAGFIAGLFINRFVELKMPSFPGYGKPVAGPLKQDDVILIGVGVGIMLLSRFVAKVRFLFYFGLGFASAVAIDELMELALGEVA